ncbi:putative catalyzes the transfer of endogenously produced octanoic acid from octanoyl-acyl-carrier-protein onto the lipoyl domains of lipoate-dependent enzymes [Lyophyllum shimeji]|uniref:Octanoyltransferase n=1 Tax=Lyophyllum shimeji TaxID=47721 RepID=A0A9P3PID8_LYOSH|nr:putative catalyzes the transfer of endogenously produced octanoic acid from octanoyl-acyl-carrier-protein onto the lipoyl domains of lipoate-dependent enzymes [Lyophyllum shimeji]
MSLPSILYHYFRRPLPYAQTLALQEKLHQLQLTQRRTGSHKDILLLLQHRPVYTAGRRQTEPTIRDERTRLTSIGADFVTTTRGGQLTYHGPGQIVGYPLLDLSRYSPTMGARDYVCRMQKALELHLKEAHAITPIPSEHTGVFLDLTTKIGSIGVQVRHRLTSHGFALNITREPIPWFDRIVACGLEGVTAGSVETATHKAVNVEEEIPGLARRIGTLYEREVVPMELEREGELGDAIAALEEEALQAGPWPATPTS